jgi:hypothetical protein
MGTFEQLLAARTEISKEFKKNNKYDAAGIFLPFRGKDLQEGGFYYIGQATRGDWWACEEQSAANSLLWSNEFIRSEGKPVGGGTLYAEQHRNFWKFCDQMCRSLFDSGMLESRERWGWSNLLKIGAFNSGDRQDGPSSWGDEMHEIQRGACIACLRDEVSALQRTVIYVASTSDLNICKEVFGEAAWRRGEEVGDTWVRVFPWDNDNIVCHGPHPQAIMRQQGRFMGRRAEDIAAHVSSLYNRLPRKT